MFGAVLSLIVAVTTPPAVHEHFPEEGTPAHAFLVVDVATGDIVRADDSDACDREPVPLGTGRHLLAALAELEAGRLDAEETIACDSTCWARGDHGEVALVNALAWGCQTYADELPREAATIRSAAESIGLDADGPTLRAWTEFWRRADRVRLRIGEETLSNLLAAGATAVSSPRGMARALYDPRRTSRVFVGEAESGSWVAGVTTLSGGRRWAFALFVRHGAAKLATTRCAHLLDETRRIYRTSTRERGGEPWSEFD